MARRTIFAEDKERGKVSSFAARKILAAWALKIIALATLIYLTTNNVIDRIDALWTYAAYVPLAIFSLLWALCIASFAVASFHPKLSVRCAWGVPLALTGALAFTFRHFTATDLNPQEILSLWQARHEAGRALSPVRGPRCFAPRIAQRCARSTSSIATPNAGRSFGTRALTMLPSITLG